MKLFAAGLAGVIVLGVIVAVAFGPGALWIYGFFALLAVGTALATGVGGNVITAWSRRRFEDERPARR